MIYIENDLVKDPQKKMAELFGFKENFEKIKNMIYPKDVSHKENKDKLYCKMCGKIREKRIIDPKNSFIGSNNNDFYNFTRPHSPFICEYCSYLYKIAEKKSQKKYIGSTIHDVSDVIIYNDRIDKLNKENKRAKLYEILKNPPKEAFMILLKRAKSNRFYIDFYKALPAVDSEYFCINHGFNRYFVSRKKILTGLEEVLESITKSKTIFKRLKKSNAKLSPSALLSSLDDKPEKIMDYQSHNIRDNKEIWDMCLYFLKNYTKDERAVIMFLYNEWDEKIRKLE